MLMILLMVSVDAGCPRKESVNQVSSLLLLLLAAVPSPELVDRVRDLYQKRVSDVRFLIPVLNGLSKVSSSVLSTTLVHVV